MAAISQTTFSIAWMKSFVFLFEFHWSLFLSVQLTTSQQWFRVGAKTLPESVLPSSMTHIWGTRGRWVKHTIRILECSLLTGLPISFRITSLALMKSYNCVCQWRNSEGYGQVHHGIQLELIIYKPSTIHPRAYISLHKLRVQRALLWLTLMPLLRTLSVGWGS